MSMPTATKPLEPTRDDRGIRCSRQGRALDVEALVVVAGDHIAFSGQRSADRRPVGVRVDEDAGVVGAGVAVEFDPDPVAASGKVLGFVDHVDPDQRAGDRQTGDGYVVRFDADPEVRGWPADAGAWLLDRPERAVAGGDE